MYLRVASQQKGATVLRITTTTSLNINIKSQPPHHRLGSEGTKSSQAHKVHSTVLNRYVAISSLINNPHKFIIV